jgi:hypothetical protein
MSQPEFLSVPDAALALAVNPSRVRALLASGQLEGLKVGGRWLVPWAAIWERQDAPRERGRLLAPANAWAVLALASGKQPEWISRDEQRRLARLIEVRGFDRLVPRLRERADLQRFYGHPGILRELAESPELVKAAASAARRHRLRLVAGEEVDAYVSESRMPRLVKRMALEPHVDGANVRLRIIPAGLWPFDEEFAPRAAVAVDLAELPDARAKRIGHSAIREIAQERQWRRALERHAAADRAA